MPPKIDLTEPLLGNKKKRLFNFFYGSTSHKRVTPPKEKVQALPPQPVPIVQRQEEKSFSRKGKYDVPLGFQLNGKPVTDIIICEPIPEGKFEVFSAVRETRSTLLKS